MSTCICNSCKNLKTVIDEIDQDENGIAEECEFGFPAESCSDCEEGHCELTCDHYMEDCEEEAFAVAECAKCGKELKVSASNAEAGEVYCPICYLNK